MENKKNTIVSFGVFAIITGAFAAISSSVMYSFGASAAIGLGIAAGGAILLFLNSIKLLPKNNLVATLIFFGVALVVMCTISVITTGHFFPVVMPE